MINSSFLNVQPQDSSDSSPKLIELPSIALNDQSNYTIHDTYIDRSTVGFIELSGIKNSDTLTSNFIIQDFAYTNSYLDFSHDLISFVGVETDNNFQISLSNIDMNNITFVRTGNLIKLGHQTNTTLTLNNATFSGLYGGQIYIGSSNLQNDRLITKVSMTNITAASLSGASNSFVSINEGGQVYIYDSNFTNIDNTQRGAMLNAGYQNSYIEVHNSTFKNNLSIYGGVANVQDSSVIKFYDCNITDNFAIQSGAIQVSSDGHFELYR